ncbi:MAG: CDP-glycerol glycerophosphotransferase family protein [Eubacterium sp.]|nr:CDP-glycerol glycerophosphotransferase family protein [Eubacterium sp.]
MIDEKIANKIQTSEAMRRNELQRVYDSSLAKQRSAAFIEAYNTMPLEENKVLYESFYGRGMVCNPNGLFHSFLERPDFSAYKHVWVIEDFESNEEIMKEYSQMENVSFVEYLSDEYFRQLATSKYLVNNVMFPGYFVKREGQVYINTWHGIPLKTLGYDQAGGNVSAANSVRNFLNADYLISPCQYFTDIYKKAFKLDGIYRGKIIEEGQPRNDLTIKGNRKEIIERMRRSGVKVDENKKIILYAPTWKGQNYSNPTVNPEEYYEFIRYIESRVDTDQYQVLVKPHQVVYQYMREETANTDQFIPAVLDANEILAVTDVLISDYSSIYFDFMVCDKPILFYIPDVESYKNYRGLYLPLEELPGPISKDLETIGDWLGDLDQVWKQYKDKFQEIKDRFVYLDDGKSADRVWDVVLEHSNDHHVINGLLNDKKRMLMYIGITHVNGITETFGSLLNMMDYDKFDVTVIALDSKDGYEKEKLEKLNPNARVLMRVGTYAVTFEEHLRLNLIVDYGMTETTKPYYDEYVFSRELRRHVGDAEFDYVVNYTGYSPIYTLLFMHAKGAKRYVWQHNDLQQDMMKVVNGKRVNKQPLESVFSLYPYQDYIVACSKSVMETNRKNLATEETYDKFRYCKNTVNFERVIDGMENRDIVTDHKQSYYMKMTISDIRQETPTAVLVPMPDPKKTNFITIGRLSPEKNHENLILAFCKYHEKHPDTCLYIMGGGLLEEKLKELIIQKNARDYVKLLLNVSNPFGLMKECDCFILPSHFEGQPIVILEARTIGLPIIVSDFSTVKDSLYPDGQLLIGQGVEDIYQGLMDFSDGKVPNFKFDSQKYNREAYEEFESLF